MAAATPPGLARFAELSLLPEELRPADGYLATLTGDVATASAPSRSTPSRSRWACGDEP